MDTDRELLELAAKAAGIDDATYASFDGMDIRYGFSEAIWSDSLGEYWNPLADDGDALRLAVKLHLIVEAGANRTIVFHPGADESVQKPIEWYEHSEPYAATRRAIVRAAAEIGRSMK